MLRYRLLSLLLIAMFAVAGVMVGATRLRAATPAIVLAVPAELPPAGETINVLINIVDAANLGAWQFDLSYDPTLVTVTGMTIDPAFAAEDDCNAQTGRCAVALGPIVDSPGTASFGVVTYGKAAGLNGYGQLAVIHLKATGKAGETALTLSNALVTDVNAQATTPMVIGGTLVLSAPVNRLFLPNVTR